jgi:hypothetical protein
VPQHQGFRLTRLTGVQTLQTTVDLLSALLVGSLVLGVGLLALRSERKERSAIWRDFGASNLLSAGEGNCFAGELDGTPVVLRELIAATPDSVSLCCGLTPALPREFFITRTSFGGRLGPWFSENPDALTDDQLDAAFGAPNGNALLRDRGVRLAFLRAAGKYPNLRIGNGVLELRKKKLEAHGELELMLRHGVAVAKALREAAARQVSLGGVP